LAERKTEVFLKHDLKYGTSRGSARGCVYSVCLSFSLTLCLASTSAASAAACAASRRYRRAAYPGSVSQWVASPFKAASSPTRPERSRAVSLATSLWSCGPIYVTTGGATCPCSRTHPGGHPTERRDPPLGLRAGPARGGTGIARAANPGGPDGGLGQQPHGVGLRKGPGQPLQPRQQPASRSRARSAIRISSTKSSRRCSIASSAS
jgi:hypothetical protein